MADVVVVMPSRGRPRRAADALRALRGTATQVSTTAVLVTDADDPAWPEYAALRFDDRYAVEVTHVTLHGDETGSLVRATNTVSMRIAQTDPECIIGNLGDDHHARTVGWDKKVTDALRTPGVAYGRDGIHDEHLPTAPFISAEIVLALGYYFLPDVAHMYADNAVRDVGAQTGTLRYLPDVFIEHMHPFAGKAEWDEAYERVNAEEPVREDRLHYESWREHAMAIDIGRVRNVLAARPE